MEPMEQFDEDEGLPEKIINKNQQFHKSVPCSRSLSSRSVSLSRFDKGDCLVTLPYPLNGTVPYGGTG